MLSLVEFAFSPFDWRILHARNFYRPKFALFARVVRIEFGITIKGIDFRILKLPRRTCEQSGPPIKLAKMSRACCIRVVTDRTYCRVMIQTKKFIPGRALSKIQ